VPTVRVMDPKPYRIAVSDDTLDELAWRLDHTRWTTSLQPGSWADGTDAEYLRELCGYWRHGYDWRSVEDGLNALPQFAATIDGLDVHFFRRGSASPTRLPLLLLHGWPSSAVEYLDVAGRLSDPVLGESTEVVVASLPGFGFGGQPRERGWGISRMARAMDTLMRGLGHDRYGVVGTDWGGAVGAHLAATCSDRCAGLWTTPHFARTPRDASAEVVAVIEDFRRRQKDELGYAVIQRTRPDSLAVAQNDSPAGVAAWIVEKFRAWGDVGDDIESVFSKDVLLTTAMFYWAPGSVASAARIYSEAARDPEGMTYPPVEVPVAMGVFPSEPFGLPREVVQSRYRITRWTEFDRGGHFPGLEVPDLLASDVRGFFGALS
jgi:pimeloyl-ACP methyl ester carboxylesterase